MSSYQKVKDRLQGCRPFAWYLRRFKAVYEDAGIIPAEIFMIRERGSGKCLHFQGGAGTSGAGTEGVVLDECDTTDHSFFWHLGNRNKKTGKCCGGLRAWNTDQCFEGTHGSAIGKAITAICELSGSSNAQKWSLLDDGRIKQHGTCLGVRDGELFVEPCSSWQSGHIFEKAAATEPLETRLYRKAQADHPEVFAKLNQDLRAAEESHKRGPEACHEKGKCKVLVMADDALDTCIDGDGEIVKLQEGCAPLLLVGNSVQLAEGEGNQCLDTWSDQDPLTWGFYGCHGGTNQQFTHDSSRSICSAQVTSQCFVARDWQLTLV